MPGEVEEFLRPLVVEKIPGVGAVTRERLRGLEVDTIGQLANVPQEQLVHRFGKRGTYLFRLARGIDDDPVSPVREPKQLSSETTFASDLFDVTKMRSALGDLCGEVAQRLQRRRLRGRAVTLKARYPDFSTVTRSQTLPAELKGVEAIAKVAEELLARTEAEFRGVRLLGVGVSRFEDEGGRQANRQLDLFELAVVDG